MAYHETGSKMHGHSVRIGSCVRFGHKSRISPQTPGFATLEGRIRSGNLARSPIKKCRAQVCRKRVAQHIHKQCMHRRWCWGSPDGGRATTVRWLRGHTLGVVEKGPPCPRNAHYQGSKELLAHARVPMQRGFEKETCCCRLIVVVCALDVPIAHIDSPCEVVVFFVRRLSSEFVVHCVCIVDCPVLLHDLIVWQLVWIYFSRVGDRNGYATSR